MYSSLNDTSVEAPVEYMRLFVHVRTSKVLRVSTMAGFTEKWRELYPDIDEQPPLTTFDRGSEFEFLGDDDYWPMPFTVLSSNKADLGIMFQADRIGVFWERINTQDGVPYPGFERMKGQVLEVLGDFIEMASREETDVQPTQVECVYENVLDGLSPSECVLGRMTNWSRQDSNAIELDTAATFDIHDHTKDSSGLPAWISLRPIHKNSATKLVIRSVVTRNDPDNNEQATGDILDTAHEVAREQYNYWIPPSIRSNAREV